MNQNSLISGAPSIRPPNGHAIPLNATKKVQVYHPGYSPPRLLLLFVAYAVDPQSAPGVPFSTVDDACRIIANNTAGTLRVLGTSVDLVPYDNQTQLAPGKYSYYINSATPRYPVCESFHAWSPPPEMPPYWTTVLDVEQVEPPPAATRSSNSDVVKTADQFCIITGESSRLRTAHLVPQAESEWWRHRAMNALTGNIDGVDSPPNCIAVRADLNGDGMDTGSFVFAVFAGKVVVVCLEHTIADFAALNHLREVVLPPRIHPLNVYVRFAWAVFRGSRVILEEFSKFTDAVLVKDTPALKKTGKKRKNEGGQDGREQDEDGSGASGDNAGGGGQTHQDDVGRGGQTRRAATASYFGITERDLLVAELLDAKLSKRPLTNRELMAETSSLVLGVTASASFGIPGIGEGSVETSVEATFTNSIGSSFETKTDSAVEHSITLNAAPGSVCKLHYSVESCYSSSKGEVPFIAAGWVWFNCNKQTHGHYKWAINLAGYTAESQRSSYTHFTGGINAHSTGNYHGECT
ncbi:hypothetical protein C8J57DRAFT_1484030 [Mycena rebaudengoi]|nr:hypothetical protein C8J57DRAFT_1484030 [Mycena rebaudengoi]